MRLDDWRKLPPSLRYERFRNVLRIVLFVATVVVYALGLYWRKFPDYAARSLILVFVAFLLGSASYTI